MKKVLLVDDDPIANFLTRLMVEEDSDCEIEMAENGQEALDLINNRAKEDLPDLILLDLNMPVMNGHDFLTELEKMHQDPKVKIIILSSSSATKDLREVSKKKVQGYLTKPLTEDKLQQILQILNT